MNKKTSLIFILPNIKTYCFVVLLFAVVKIKWKYWKNTLKELGLQSLIFYYSYGYK